MNKYIKNEYGFTLLEMLLVLFIVSLISSITFYFTMKISEKKEIDHFFFQLQLDFQQAQALAIETGKTIDFVFLDNNTYKVSYYWNEVILERKFPESVKMNIYSKLKKIKFDSKGNVQDFGSIGFKTSLGDRHLVIYIEKGRTRYVEG